MAILEDFEGGVVDDIYVETVSDGWTVQALNRTSGFSPPRYRPLPDPTTGVPPAATIDTDKGLRFVGSSAWALAVDYEVCAGLGGYFYSDSAGAGGWSSSSLRVQITFGNEQALGGISLDRRGNTLHIHESYDDLVTYIDNDSTVELTNFIPTESLPIPSGVWLEVSLLRSGGWDIRDAMTGGVLAHGDYPWTVPAGASWHLGMQPNSSGPTGPAGSITVMADNIYGFPGSLGTVVRLFPRDDGRGMSSAPRIWPLPKGRSRIIGGHQ